MTTHEWIVERFFVGVACILAIVTLTALVIVACTNSILAGYVMTYGFVALVIWCIGVAVPSERITYNRCGYGMYMIWRD